MDSPRGVTMGCRILRGDREYELLAPRDADGDSNERCPSLAPRLLNPELSERPCCSNSPRSFVKPPLLPRTLPRLALSDGGVNVCQPGRDDCTELPLLNPPRLPLNPPDPFELFGRSNEPGRLPPEFPLLLPPLNPRFSVFPCTLPPLKKCCEFDGALRNDPGFAVRPEALKLSRDGFIGTRPEKALALCKDASLNPG